MGIDGNVGIVYRISGRNSHQATTADEQGSSPFHCTISSFRLELVSDRITLYHTTSSPLQHLVSYHQGNQSHLHYLYLRLGLIIHGDMGRTKMRNREETPTSVESRRRQILLLVTHSCTRTQFLSSPSHWGVQLVVAHITSTRQIQDQFSLYHRILEMGDVLVQPGDFVLFAPLESESCTVIKHYRL